MTVVLSNKTPGQLKSKCVKTGEINEFNQQTNKSQKKVKGTHVYKLINTHLLHETEENTMFYCFAEVSVHK